jgi:hypothetical protein
MWSPCILQQNLKDREKKIQTHSQWKKICERGKEYIPWSKEKGSWEGHIPCSRGSKGKEELHPQPLQAYRSFLSAPNRELPGKI